MLKWPQEPELEPVPIGISWLELYFNFQVVTGATIPVNVPARGDEDERLVWMDEQQVFTVDSFPYDRYVQYFRFCVEHLQKFSIQRLWPDISRRKTGSLHVLGASGFRQGLIVRPQLPLQQETIAGLRRYLLSVPNRSHFDDHPDIPKLPPMVARTLCSDTLTTDELQRHQKQLLAEKRKQKK